MKLFPQGTKSYESAARYVSLTVDELVAKLGKLNASTQITAIDTMYNIIATDHSYLRSSASVTAVQIRNAQRERVAQWGDKAYGLSDAQLGVIARDIVSLAATKEVA
jgi:hypothetical protein